MERLENMIATRSVENIEIVKMGKETEMVYRSKVISFTLNSMNRDIETIALVDFERH